VSVSTATTVLVTSLTSQACMTLSSTSSLTITLLHEQSMSLRLSWDRLTPRRRPQETTATFSLRPTLLTLPRPLESTSRTWSGQRRWMEYLPLIEPLHLCR
jgi:hypothetical protein